MESIFQLELRERNNQSDILEVELSKQTSIIQELSEPIDRLSTAEDKQRRTKLLEEAFAVEYVRNGFNATKALMSIRKGLVYDSARATAPTILQRASVQTRILQLLPVESLGAKVLSRALEAETPAMISWKDKHRFWSDALRLRGHLLDRSKGNTDVRIGLVISK